MIEQRSDEWFAQRCGKVTASRIADVTAKTKTGWGAGRANYMAQLVAERLTGNVEQSYINTAMQWGIDTEPQAVAAYEAMKLCTVDPAPFVVHPSIADAGASPDGFVGEWGLIECKCPNTATHIDTLLKGKIDGRYIKQMQWQMACTGRQWCDFVSYDPRLNAELALFSQRVDRDDDMIAEIEWAVLQFTNEIAGKVSQLQQIMEAL